MDVKDGSGPAGPRAEESGPARPRRRPRHRSVGPSGRGADVERVLALAAKEAFTEMFGPREDRIRAFPLQLSVVVEPGSPWRIRAEPGLEEQVRAAVREMATRADAFRRGRVYCYRCESAECSHSIAPRPTSVFGGYTPTGLPRWPELTQLLLDLRHPRVDQLFEPSGRELVAIFMGAEELKLQQLGVFGRYSKDYDVLGQVVFGFLRIPLPDRVAQESERIALTIQAVESRGPDGMPRLELNVLGQRGDGSPATDSLTDPHQVRILNLIRDARRRIQHIVSSGTSRAGRRPPSLPGDALARTERVLRETARGLERLGRQTARRTMHAEARREFNRPTSKAWEDAADARKGQILWDEQRKTVIVLGPRHRVHVFSPDGRHITSLLLNGEAIEGRVRRRRWRPMEGDGLERFCAAVGRDRA